MAINLSPSGTQSLIRAYLGYDPVYGVPLAHAPHGGDLTDAFRHEIRFANPNDLAAVIKWGMSRLGKVLAVPIPISEPNRKGDVQEETAYVQQRGFLDVDLYTQWRDEEKSEWRIQESLFGTF